MTAFIIAGVIALLAIIFFFSTYTIVGANEAHVVITMGKGRRIISSVKKDGIDGNTSYFFIPFLMKKYIMPLTNVKLDINDINLNDREMAPFVCDVVTWLHVEDPVKAVERLNTEGNIFGSLHSDLTAIVQAIARAASMKQEILDIMRDRTTFSTGVSSEVDVTLRDWGVKLVNLEVNDIRDAEDSEVIQNYEMQRKATIESQTRIAIANRDREAVEVEQSNKKMAETATANAEKAYKTSQIERDAALGIAEQTKQQTIAEAEAITNSKKIDALRVTEVGKAQVIKEAIIEKAKGEGESIRITGEKEADVVTLKGNAEASATKAKGLADAAAKDAMAEALKKFNDAGISLEKIKAAVSMQQFMAEAYGKIAENADIKIVTSGEGKSLFGIPMNAQTGADLGQLLEAFGSEKVSGVVQGVKDSIKNLKN